MKVITVIQPWATLIALGEKKFETRSWATKYRGELAIHAGKKIDKELCRVEPFRSILAKNGFDEKNLPTGAIIAGGKLHDCLRIHGDTGISAKLADKWVVSGNEYFFGNYSDGRYAWELRGVYRLDDPIPAKGQLSLWNYPMETSQPSVM